MNIPAPAVERPSALGPFLGACLFGAPGALTYSFALHETTQYDGDWVLISASLLVLGAVCAVLGLWRLIGGFGLGFGIVTVIASCTVAFLTLHDAITERQEYRANVQAQRKALKEYCQGEEPQPQPQAMRYKRNGKRSLYPVEVLEADAPYGDAAPIYHTSYHKAYEDWRPRKPSLKHTAMVACIEAQTTTLETCHYDVGTASRVRTDSHIRLYALRTGEQIFESVLQGQEPRTCEANETFTAYQGENGLGLSKTIVGEQPSAEQVVEALRPYMESERKVKGRKSPKTDPKKKRKKRRGDDEDREEDEGGGAFAYDDEEDEGQSSMYRPQKKKSKKKKGKRGRGKKKKHSRDD